VATLDVLITRTLDLLSLVGGLNVQTYAQPKIVQYIQMGYTTLFDKRFWDDYTTVETYDLDGVTGKTTQDLTDILKTFKDFQYIWYHDWDVPLPRMPSNRNPSHVTQLCFTTSGDPRCLFKVIPYDTTGTVSIRVRTRANTPFVEGDEVPMDEELLVRWAALMYATNDNANPQLTQTFTQLFTDRLDALTQLEQQHSKSLYSYSDQTVNQWNTI
jgi:hypothetical protein